MTSLDHDPTLSKDGELLSYYEFIGISENENDLNVIKQRYRKLAQQYHPDKLKNNKYGDKPFKYLQSAYNTLIDTQQRAIYDKNRKTLTDPFQYTATFINMDHFRNQIEGLDIENELNTFCMLVQAFIKQIFDEEILSARSQLKSINSNDKKYSFLKYRVDNGIPSFGDPDTDIQEVLKFYNKMKGFNTVKLMSFANVYSLDGYNSAERYYINQINQQSRDVEIDKFTEQIRGICEYIKTKDVRVIRHMQWKKLEEQRQRQEFKQKQEQEKMEKEEKSRRINQERKERLQFLQDKIKSEQLTPDEMLEFERLTIKPMTSRQNYEEQLKQEKKNKSTEKQVTIHELVADKSLLSQGLALDNNKKLYCTICLQRFAMEGEFKNHLSSKRHKKALSEKPSENESANDKKVEANIQKKGNKSQKSKQRDDQDQNVEDSDGQDNFQKDKNKKGKTQKSNGGRPVDPSLQCLKCKQVFESRTKLFNHIKETGHAAPKK